MALLQNQCSEQQQYLEETYRRMRGVAEFTHILQIKCADYKSAGQDNI